MCRIGFVETARAIGLSAGAAVLRAFKREWDAFGVVEVDAALVEHAATLALSAGLRRMDALHLAAALVLPSEGSPWRRSIEAERSHPDVHGGQERQVGS
jgi:hypothetical protein